MTKYPSRWSHSAPWEGFEHTPRDWQAKAADRAVECLQSGTSAVVSAVMGAGKSAVIGELCHRFEGTVVVTTPRVRLVHQLHESIASRVGPLAVGKFFGGDKDADSRIIVCCMPSVGTLAEYLGDEPVDLWIADEAHRTECDTMLEAYEAIEPACQIGFTATPYRAETAERLSLFEELAFEYTATDAMQDGVVVPIELRHWTGGDTDLDEACETLIAEALDDGYTRGMVNARTIDGAEAFAEQLDACGIRSEAVHSRRQNAEAVMRKLERGELQCVVHVDMLAEGVNYPWLEYLCLRRPVQSRVRFCQEVGRVLRAHPGKEHALILDPLDLFDSFGLDYEAVLGGGDVDEPEPEDKAADDVGDVLDSLEVSQDTDSEETDPHGVPVRVLGPVRSWLRNVKLRLQADGLLETKISSTHWRSDRPSPKQISLVNTAIAGIVREHIPDDLPDEHCRALKAAVRAAALGSLKKGDVSDLISIVFALKGMPTWAKETP